MPPEPVGPATACSALDDDACRVARPLTRAEFASEFERAAPALWCVAAGITNDRAGVEDIVQQAAVTALERLDRFERATNFIGWMARIVRHTAMNEVRKTRRRHTMPTDPELLDGEGVGDGPAHLPPEQQVIPLTPLAQIVPAQQDLDDRLLAALGRLSPEARTCLLLRVLLDLPYRQISALLDMPQGTAMSHVDRSRRTLRSLLEPYRTVSNSNGENALDPPRRPAA